MPVLHIVYDMLANPAVYRMWQAPFADAKFGPIRRHNDLQQVRRVLDAGCGPGTNAHLFYGLDYLGLDLNPKYIESARKRHPLQFDVADLCTWDPPDGRKFDFILLNSLLHHLDTPSVHRLLSQLSRLLTPDGHVHIVDLILPAQLSLSRGLALADRGDYPRPQELWQEIFEQHFQPVVFEPFSLTMAGLSLWQLVYFKGAAR